MTERGVQVFAAALTPVLRHAHTLGVKISIENTPQTSPEDFNTVFKQLECLPEVTHGGVGMCFDMGHANLFPATHNDYLGFIDRLGLHVPIIHWHAHENWGDRDSHLPLFTGPSRLNDTGVRGLVWRLIHARLSRQRRFGTMAEPAGVARASPRTLTLSHSSDVWADLRPGDARHRPTLGSSHSGAEPWRAISPSFPVSV